MSALRDHLKKYRSVGQSADWIDEAWQLTQHTVLTVDDEDERWSFISYIEHDDYPQGKAFNVSCEEDTEDHILLILKDAERAKWHIDDASGTAVDVCTANAEADIASQQIQHGTDDAMTVASNHQFEV